MKRDGPPVYFTTPGYTSYPTNIGDQAKSHSVSWDVALLPRASLLHDGNLINLAVDLKVELTLRIRDLNRPIILSHAIGKLIHNSSLSIIRLAGAALLGRRIFNWGHLNIALLRKITLNRELIGNLLSTCGPEDLSRNNNGTLNSILVNKGVLEISRIHVNSLNSRLWSQGADH